MSAESDLRTCGCGRRQEPTECWFALRENGESCSQQSVCAAIWGVGIAGNVICASWQFPGGRLTPCPQPPPHRMQNGIKLAGWIQICRIPTAGSTVVQSKLAQSKLADPQLPDPCLLNLIRGGVAVDDVRSPQSVGLACVEMGTSCSQFAPPFGACGVREMLSARAGSSLGAG